MIKAKCQTGSIWYVIIHLMRECVSVCVCNSLSMYRKISARTYLNQVDKWDS